ncbi:MAG: GLUG motif-containing protein [Acutalibacteraceae bacterium]
MKTHKLLSVILSLVITISSLSFAAVSASAAEITPKEPDIISEVYQIGTKEELYWFADKVNNDNANYGSASAVLTADIVVNTDVLNDSGELNTGTFTSWTPIGNDSNKYTGTFDGQGHTVSGLYFNGTSTDYVGLFGYLGSGGEIKNTGVIDSYFNGANSVGGVCGNKASGTITGCYNTGTVSGSSYVGGVCGRNIGTITGCYNTGTVSGSSYVGGVCGYNSNRITGCYSTGTVSGSSRVGGVCGELSSNSYLARCYTNSTPLYAYAGYNARVINCAVYTGDEFKDGTVCALLNMAIGSSYNFYFYQGEETPLLSSQTDNRYCTVIYTVAPSYTVTIPKTVKLGQTATIKAENVVLEEEKQLEVTLTATSETDNAFKVKSAEGAELTYTVTKQDNTTVNINDKILTVNPDNSDTGSATLNFNPPSTAKFSGSYKGTVTFTLSVV